MLGQDRSRERERKNSKNKIPQSKAKSSQFSLYISRLTHTYTLRKLKTTPKKDQGKEKGRIKEEERRKKEEEGQTSNSISNLIIKTKSIMYMLPF